MARARDVMARPHGLLLAGLLCVLARGATAHAQSSGTASRPTIQPEARVDFIDARAAAAHVGVGFSVPAGTYVRLGIVGAAGQAWRHGESGGAGRVDALVRFVVDPLREFRWAPYAAGGIGGIYDRSEKWRAVLVGVLGIEGPASGSVVPAIEIGFGGGARVGVVIRRAMPGRR
ncbi:MAG TPA: hypothetical protein VM076_18965 [Gemmatimonadaceae bacterium]|nr:hypothetical protein [Gemmatimonadaceae bacterium]